MRHPLLGIDFHNNLENMDNNFFHKTAEIDKLLSSWLYRYLTPFGKITVIKSLGISKLSHIALVLPAINNNMTKDLEKILFRFLWNGKTDKVARKATYLPVSQGGLGMVDIKSFWAALKFSWIRRISTSEAFWTKILNEELAKSHHSTNSMLSLGPLDLAGLSKQIKNKFWSNVFKVASSMTTAAAYAMPNKLMLFPIFRNTLFKVGNRAIQSNVINGNNGRVNQVADFFKAGSQQFYSLQEFNAAHGTAVEQGRYDRIVDAIVVGIRSLNFNLGEAELHQQPRQSILTHIACSNTKGCRKYYDILRRQESDKVDTSGPENKWHTELGRILSIDFWNKAWISLSRLKLNNDLKWIQLQVLRNILKTNTIVCKFVPLVNDQCDFCHNSQETIRHLLFSCRLVQKFWNDLNLFLADNNIPQLPLNRLNILFGSLSEDCNSRENMLILLAKKFIWTAKFKDTAPKINIFKNTLKYFLYNQNIASEIRNKSDEFDNMWGRLYHILL